MSRPDGTDEEMSEEAKQAAYDEQERLIEENRQKGSDEPPSQVIRWAYRSKINDSVYCMNEDGLNILIYSGKFADLGAKILGDAPPEAEFYTSFSGELSFAPQTREQWGK